MFSHANSSLWTSLHETGCFILRIFYCFVSYNSARNLSAMFNRSRCIISILGRFTLSYRIRSFVHGNGHELMELNRMNQEVQTLLHRYLLASDNWLYPRSLFVYLKKIHVGVFIQLTMLTQHLLMIPEYFAPDQTPLEISQGPYWI